MTRGLLVGLVPTACALALAGCTARQPADATQEFTPMPDQRSIPSAAAPDAAAVTPTPAQVQTATFAVG